MIVGHSEVTLSFEVYQYSIELENPNRLSESTSEHPKHCGMKSIGSPDYLLCERSSYLRSGRNHSSGFKNPSNSLHFGDMLCWPSRVHDVEFWSIAYSKTSWKGRPDCQKPSANILNTTEWRCELSGPPAVREMQLSGIWPKATSCAQKSVKILDILSRRRGK